MAIKPKKSWEMYFCSASTRPICHTAEGMMSVMAVIELADPAEVNGLMDAKAYAAFLEAEAK